MIGPVQLDPQPPVVAGLVYVSNEGSNTVSVLQDTGNIANVSVGPGPLQGAYDPHDGLFFVPDSGANEISVLSGAGLDANIQLQGTPSTPAFDPLNGYMYVPITGGPCGTNDTASNATSCGGGIVSVFSGLTIVANVTVGGGPLEPVVDTNMKSPYYGFVYVPNGGSQTISVISGTNDSVVATIGSGASLPLLFNPPTPGGGVYDPYNDYIYMGTDIIQGINAIAPLPSLSLTSQALNGITPQFQVSCDDRCVYDPYNGLVYEPGDPNQPFFDGFVVINGTSAAAAGFGCSCSDHATFDPLNGWLYLGATVVSGSTPFALNSPISGALYGTQSFDPEDASIFGIVGSEAIRIGNACGPPIGVSANYSVLDATLCDGAPPPQVSSANVTLNNMSPGAVAAFGTHVFSIMVDSVALYAGQWTATSATTAKASSGNISFQVTGQSGATGYATISVPKPFVAALLFAQSSAGTLSAPASSFTQLPTLYVDGAPAKVFSWTQDGDNFYITFRVHFSTDNVTIAFTQVQLVNATANSISSTTNAGSSSISSSGNTLSGSTSTSQAGSSSSSGSGGLELAVSNTYLLIVGVSMGVILLASVLAKVERAKISRERMAP